MRIVKFSFSKKQTEFEAAVRKHGVVLYGGAKGGGKSHGLRALMLKRRLEYPGTHGVIFRRTYEELESNHIRKILQEYPFLKKCYKKQERLLELPNGSTLEFCHCRFLDELDLYQGREWEDIAIDEVGQWPFEWVIRLRGSNRTSKPGLRPRMLLTGNPGGIGHQWMRRLFISREFTSRENAGDYAFVQAFVHDNPALMEHDPEYLLRLEAEPNEMLRRAFLYGDWDLCAGQFFSELTRDVHLVAPFKIPDHWRRWISYDPGYHHPAAVAWFAQDEDGVAYMYRYYCKRGQRLDQIAAEIARYDDFPKIYQAVGGLDCWNKGRDGGPSIADQLGAMPDEMRLHLIKANVDRRGGAEELRARLAWQDLPQGQKGPRFYFFDLPDVRRAFESMVNMTFDPNRPEDVLKVDASGTDDNSGDEAYDVIRYGLMAWPLKAKALPQEKILTVDQTRLARVQRWKEKQKRRRLNRKDGWDAVLGRYVN